MLATMAMTAVLAVNDAPAEPAAWTVPILAVLTLIFGGGGVAAILKARYDKKIGVAQQENAEDDSISIRWQRIIEAQTASLVGPLQKRLAEVEEKVKTLENELTETRAKYWKAVKYIRTLMSWITIHVPADDSKTPPIPPAEVVEDI